jgi:hypothetical protein
MVPMLFKLQPDVPMDTIHSTVPLELQGDMIARYADKGGRGE